MIAEPYRLGYPSSEPEPGWYECYPALWWDPREPSHAWFDADGYRITLIREMFGVGPPCAELCRRQGPSPTRWTVCGLPKGHETKCLEVPVQLLDQGHWQITSIQVRKIPAE